MIMITIVIIIMVITITFTCLKESNNTGEVMWKNGEFGYVEFEVFVGHT